jgi:hypothetical protein
MIWESGPWKDELLANARVLEQYANSTRRSGRRSFRIERAVFLSAYVMRKLWESGKLSSSWQRRKVFCIFHPPKTRKPDRLSWHRIDEHYRLDISKSDSVTAIEFCHRLIHSYVFIEVEGPGKTVVGFFFASDQTKNRGLWFVALVDLLALLKETGRDYPSSSRMVRHPKTSEWVVWAGHGEPPSEWSKMADAMTREYAALIPKRTGRV